MKTYLKELMSLFKDWKKAVPVIIFTVARIIYGWSWFSHGIEKIAWFSDGKLNSTGMVGTLAANLAGPKVTRFDPLYINKAFAWIADNIFNGMPAVTDVLVVICEILVGALIILGFRVFIAALVAVFLNLQFMAGGSFNNFGYIWTDLIIMKFAKYFEAIGLDGFLRAKKGKPIL